MTTLLSKRPFSVCNRTTIAALAAVACLSACGTSSAAGPNKVRENGGGMPAPGWITGRTPTEEGCVFAVGTSGPTFDPEDARRYAQDDARAQLATTLSARVQALA